MKLWTAGILLFLGLLLWTAFVEGRGGNNNSNNNNNNNKKVGRTTGVHQSQGDDHERVIITTSRVFANVPSPLGGSSNNSSSDGWYKRLRWIPQSDIKIVRFIDSGRFSNVFEATLDINNNNGDDEDVDQDGDSAVYWSSSTPSTAILKVLKHTFSGKVKREIRILELLKDAPGIVRLVGASKNSVCYPKTISLLFEHLPNVQWLSHLRLPPTEGHGNPNDPDGAWSLAEIRLFIYKLLRALHECHRRGIMHRDVKPRNVICQRHSRELRLIDFGLSELYVAGGKYNPSVASRHYKCPELLVEYNYYDYGVDIWAAGCMLAGLIFNCEPFFYGANVSDQIHVICSVLGSKAMLDWVRRYKIKLTPTMRKAIGKNHPAIPLESFVNAKNAALCSPEAIDLLKMMLCIDHQERATAEMCLNHAFFDPVRRDRNFQT